MLMNPNRNITVTELAEQLKLSESTVNRAIRSLIDKGVISREGPKKGGYWNVFWKRE
jgi:predicted transcriptional regulator